LYPSLERIGGKGAKGLGRSRRDLALLRAGNAMRVKGPLRTTSGAHGKKSGGENKLLRGKKYSNNIVGSALDGQKWTSWE